MKRILKYMFMSLFLFVCCLALGARALIPAHAGRFTIANHPWDEPFKRLKEASHDKSYRLLTPKIGEPVVPNDAPSQFSHWWEAEASNL